MNPHAIGLVSDPQDAYMRGPRYHDFSVNQNIPLSLQEVAATASPERRKAGPRGLEVTHHIMYINRNYLDKPLPDVPTSSGQRAYIEPEETQMPSQTLW